VEKVICKPNDLCTHLFLQLRPSFKENVHVRALNANSSNRVACYKGHENFQRFFNSIFIFVGALFLVLSFSRVVFFLGNVTGSDFN